MAIDLGALSGATNKAGTIGNLILVTPNKNVGYQPQVTPPAPGISGPVAQKPPTLLFHYEGEQSVVLAADITDHYIEDNTAIQDQIARKPIIVNTRGYIGELNDVVPDALSYLKLAASKLTVISAYAPNLSLTAIRVYNNAAQLYQVAQNAAAAAVSAWSSIPGATSLTDFAAQNKQQKMFTQFKGYFNLNTLFTVQTPWGAFDNMAIVTLRAIQGEDTNMISDFEVSFKQLKFASTRVAAFSDLQFDGRSNNQNTPLSDHGAIKTGANTPFQTTSSGLV